ncbi:MAG: SDR family oxidoreductase [Rhodospirillales bacterium]|nr:SDR family oxidoreductase [Rhodospirillales bacterium]
MAGLTNSPGLQGKRALVTGAGRGIGAATARLLAAQGCQVGIHYRIDRAAAEGVQAACPNSALFAADLSIPGSAAPLMDAFIDWAGGIDILVNNAGGVPPAAGAVRTLNLDSPVGLIEAAWRHFEAQRGGAVVNVSSTVAGRAASARLAPYSMAKSGLEQATRNFALAGASRGIRVNAVRPGLTDTDLNRWEDDPDRSKYAARVARVPMVRAALPEEIAAAIVFLASGLASYTTGTILTLAGGE